jgi:hypothetical protein
VGESSLELVRIVPLPYRVAEEADPLRNHGDEDPAARPKNATALSQCFSSPRDVIQAGKQGHRIERQVRKWEPGALAADMNLRVGVNVHTDPAAVCPN